MKYIISCFIFIERICFLYLSHDDDDDDGDAFSSFITFRFIIAFLFFSCSIIKQTQLKTNTFLLFILLSFFCLNYLLLL